MQMQRILQMEGESSSIALV
ncbi:hypothetical protein CFP56_029565 [Quercus suber]|uniref:Uncharacterized protein n=1 Tax=Quercus suber TaxID=58331 RepID=A0AAW0JQK4_QUESU